MQCNTKDGKQERFIMSPEAIREFSQVKANSLPQIDKKGKVHTNYRRKNRFWCRGSANGYIPL